MADHDRPGRAGALAKAEHVVRILRETAAAHEKMTSRAEAVVKAADAIATALKAGCTVYAFGNGGSAADAQHFVAELVGRYKKDRKGQRAVALTTDSSVLTAVGNDYGFDQVFARQIEALMHRGEVALAISTSGTSPNVLRALEAARTCGGVTVALTGNGGEAGKMADHHIAVDEDDTARIQEVHATVLHVICELVEMELEG